MIKTHEKIIDDFNIMITEMPAMRALKLQAKLFKIIGSPFAELLKIKSEDANSESNCFSKAISILSENLDENEFENLVLELLQSVRADGHEMKKAYIDINFAGKLNSIFKILAYVIEVNYADFFQEGSFLNQAILEIRMSNSTILKSESTVSS